MEEYFNFIDKLPRVLKIILAIIPPCFLLFTVYALLKDVKNTPALILTILLGIFPLPFIFWIANIITFITKDKVFTFGEFVK